MTRCSGGAQAIASSGGPYLAGDSVTLADLVYLPFVTRFDAALKEFRAFDLRTAGSETGPRGPPVRRSVTMGGAVGERSALTRPAHTDARRATVGTQGRSPLMAPLTEGSRTSLGLYREARPPLS